MKGLSVSRCNSEVNQHVNINQHPKGQISTSATWRYILLPLGLVPWLIFGIPQYQPFGPIQIVYRLSNFWPYLTATAATATNTPIYAWQNIFFVYIIIS